MLSKSSEVLLMSNILSEYTNIPIFYLNIPISTRYSLKFFFKSIFIAQKYPQFFNSHVANIKLNTIQIVFKNISHIQNPYKQLPQSLNLIHIKMHIKLETNI